MGVIIRREGLIMKNYYRIMLGKQSVFSQEAYKGNFIGAGWLGDIDLTNKFPQNWREFNKKYIPLYQEKNPDKTKVSAGLACAMLWTISKGIQLGDVVLCPNGQGSYYIGEVTGDYEYHKGQNLPHQRAVRWYTQTVTREGMSEPLRNSSGAIGTVSNITQYAQEIEGFVSDTRPASIISTDETIEDPSVFALEQHLEDFLVENWQNTELGQNAHFI